MYFSLAPNLWGYGFEIGLEVEILVARELFVRIVYGSGKLIVGYALHVAAFVEHWGRIGARASADNDFGDAAGVPQRARGFVGRWPRALLTAWQHGLAAVGLEALIHVGVALVCGKTRCWSAVAVVAWDVVGRGEYGGFDATGSGLGSEVGQIAASAQIHGFLPPTYVPPSGWRAQVVHVGDVAASADKALAEDLKLVEFIGKGRRGFEPHKACGLGGINYQFHYRLFVGRGLQQHLKVVELGYEASGAV